MAVTAQLHGRLASKKANAMCVVAGGHMLGKDMQPQASRREESLGNSTV
jgi:hypothetical protein